MRTAGRKTQLANLNQAMNDTTAAIETNGTAVSGYRDPRWDVVKLMEELKLSSHRGIRLIELRSALESERAHSRKRSILGTLVGTESSDALKRPALRFGTRLDVTMVIEGGIAQRHRLELPIEFYGNNAPLPLGVDLDLYYRDAVVIIFCALSSSVPAQRNKYGRMAILPGAERSQPRWHGASDAYILFKQGGTEALWDFLDALWAKIFLPFGAAERGPKQYDWLAHYKPS